MNMFPLFFFAVTFLIISLSPKTQGNPNLINYTTNKINGVKGSDSSIVPELNETTTTNAPQNISNNFEKFIELAVRNASNFNKEVEKRSATYVSSLNNCTKSNGSQGENCKENEALKNNNNAKMHVNFNTNTRRKAAVFPALITTISNKIKTEKLKKEDDVKVVDLKNTPETQILRNDIKSEFNFGERKTAKNSLNPGEINRNNSITSHAGNVSNESNHGSEIYDEKMIENNGVKGNAETYFELRGEDALPENASLIPFDLYAFTSPITEVNEITENHFTVDKHRIKLERQIPSNKKEESEGYKKRNLYSEQNKTKGTKERAITSSITDFKPNMSKRGLSRGQSVTDSVTQNLFTAKTTIENIKDINRSVDGELKVSSTEVSKVKPAPENAEIDYAPNSQSSTIVPDIILSLSTQTNYHSTTSTSIIAINSSSTFTKEKRFTSSTEKSAVPVTSPETFASHFSTEAQTSFQQVLSSTKSHRSELGAADRSSLQATRELLPTPRGAVDDNSTQKSLNFTADSNILTFPLYNSTYYKDKSNKSASNPTQKTFGTLKYNNETWKKHAPITDLKYQLNSPRTRPKTQTMFTITTETALDLNHNYPTTSIIKPFTFLTDDSVSFANLTFGNLSGSDSVVGKIIMQELSWPVKKEAVVEGDLVLGGLMMVHEREDTITCGPVMPQGGVQALEAMLYTLDRLNFATDPLLPNITLGAHILDDCDKDTYGLEMAVDFIKGSISNIDGAEYHCNKTQVRKVISGVVGAASSVTSIQVANLLRLFKIPQVSFFSTSPELSNKQRFEFFTRTIPSDHYQVKAMVDIVRGLNWSYVSIIYEESNYGIKAFEELEDLLARYNICIAVKEKLVKDSGVAEETAYDNIVQKLLTKPRARGCIIFGSDQEVAGVMRAVRRSNATGSFSWIGSDGWSARSLVSDGNEAEVEGTLSVQPQANPVQGFEEYFLSLNVENNPRNPWFVEFWEDHFQCRYPNSSKTPYNKFYTKKCTGKEKLTKQNTVFEDQLQFVSDAVMAFGYAIRDMHNELCNGRPGLCEAMKPTKGTELLKYLRKVDFQGLTGDRFHFDANGDGPARYNIIHFKQVSPGKYRWIKVGEYVEGELRLNRSEIQFKLGHPKQPESVCSLPCADGQAKKYVEGESCCWHCFNCTQYQIRNSLDETQCIPCPQGTVPDPNHVRCIDIPEEFLQPHSGWAIGAMAFSSTGILVTMFVCGVFIKHNDTPVVRASGRELSYVLLAGILMCYSVTYALVLRPTDIVCGIQRFGAGFCFTVVYAALLTKTNRISRIFNAGKHSAKRPSFISPRSQLIICSGLVGVQVLINGVWIVISPARAIHHYPTREDNLLVCSSYIDASYMIAFTYPIFLIVICTVYAVLTRKIPEAFNESKHIGFTMYTTCVIWLAFVPLYFGTANHVALRITSMSVTISLSASVTVACLFSPKLYIILIRPERNVRQSMMPMRYSAINKSSATTGSGSMMAAVMVTAATCDQKQQIQKHVPPIEKDEESDSKNKAAMKDESTQTTPHSSNNMLNNSQEHIPKINNNCNVGNGPIAILPPNVQLKDFSL